MTFSDYRETFDLNDDGQDDAVVNYADWDGDGVAHAVSAMLDTNADGVVDAVVELNPSDGTVVSTGIDMDQNGTIDVSYSGDGTINRADLNGDGISSYEEVSFASAAVDALADV